MPAEGIRVQKKGNQSPESGGGKLMEWEKPRKGVKKASANVSINNKKKQSLHIAMGDLALPKRKVR